MTRTQDKRRATAGLANELIEDGGRGLTAERSPPHALMLQQLDRQVGASVSRGECRLGRVDEQLDRQPTRPTPDSGSKPALSMPTD